LPDAVILSALPCTRQLMACYANHPGCVVATGKVDDSEVERFGIIEVVPVADVLLGNRVFRVTSLIERPDPSMVASRCGIFGRYILEPEIFEFIENTRPGRSGELQLTDSLLLCSKQRPMYAYRFEGQHYDAGSPLGFTIATLAVGLQDPHLSRPLRQYLTSLTSVVDSAAFAKTD
jgi:UTP--glucose-1-phosphate uridylyltransferase